MEEGTEECLLWAGGREGTSCVSGGFYVNVHTVGSECLAATMVVFVPRNLHQLGSIGEYKFWTKASHYIRV